MINLLKKLPFLKFLFNRVDTSTMSEGTVKWFNKKKGFGFIRLDSGQEVFAHISKIQANGYKTLKKGQRVQFFISNGSKGPQAEEISAIG